MSPTQVRERSAEDYQPYFLDVDALPPMASALFLLHLLLSGGEVRIDRAGTEEELFPIWPLSMGRALKQTGCSKSALT
jgi:hypothetical protein